MKGGTSDLLTYLEKGREDVKIMSAKSGSLTAVVSLATAIGAVVLVFPGFAQAQNNVVQNNSGAVSLPLGSIVTTTPDGTTIVIPAGGNVGGNAGQGTGGTNNTLSSGPRTSSTGTTGVTSGTQTTGVTVGTPGTGVRLNTPSTGVRLDTQSTGVTGANTGTAPAATTPLGGTPTSR